MDSAGATLAILLAGVAVVVGSVLVLRLHAFLALLLGAFVVGAFTPRPTVERYALQKEAVPIVAVDPAARTVTLKLSDRQNAYPGLRYAVVRGTGPEGRLESIGELEVRGFAEGADAEGRPERAVAVPRGGTDWLPTAGDLVVSPAALRSARRLADENVGERAAAGFGATCSNIGILIALASIIGRCLLESGAADRIVRASLAVLGERRAPLAFLSSGFLLAVPVFFDTVFYLMIPLGKALGMRTRRNYLFYVLTIVAGGTMAHSLVPPTPGPLLVAEQLGVSIGQMIVAGSIVGLATSAVGYFYARFANRRWDLPLRDSADFPLHSLEALSDRPDEKLPPTWLALLPILLPVVLMGGSAILEAAGWGPSPGLQPWVNALGDKNIALAIAAAIALGMLAWHMRASRAEMAKSVHAALIGAGEIILITAAGGAFGAVLQQTGVAGLINELPRSSPVVIITLAFLITTAIRTAQGSATVAMITAVGVLSGVASDGLGFHPVYLALAIGCGSKPISWMNDSGFWVITKMSGMTEVEGLKYITPMTALMGVAGLIITLIGATLFPMAPR